MKIGSKTHKLIKPAAGILTGVIAISTTVNVSAQKFTPNAPFINKTFVMLSRIIGPQAASMLSLQVGPSLPGGISASSLPSQGISILGPLNTSTFGGVIILVADHIIRMFGVPYYSYASPFIKALGIGTLAGGVIGGLLDPPGASTGGSRSGFSSSFSTGGPSGYAHASSIGVM